MRDIEIGRINGHTLVIRDQNENGRYDFHDDRVGVRTATGVSFGDESAAAARQLQQLRQTAGIGGNYRGDYRIAAMGNYVDAVQRARTAAAQGDLQTTSYYLNNASDAALRDQLPNSSETLADIRWQAISHYLDSNHPPQSQLHHYTALLREDTDAANQRHSSSLLFDYLSAPSDSTQARRAWSQLEGRLQRLSTIRTRGGQRTTADPQRVASGHTFRIGDLVSSRYQRTSQPLTIRSFEITADGIMAHTSDGRSYNVEGLAPAVDAGAAEAVASRESHSNPLSLAGVIRGWVRSTTMSLGL